MSDKMSSVISSMYRTSSKKEYFPTDLNKYIQDNFIEKKWNSDIKSCNIKVTGDELSCIGNMSGGYHSIAFGSREINMNNGNKHEWTFLVKKNKRKQRWNVISVGIVKKQDMESSSYGKIYEYTYPCC